MTLSSEPSQKIQKLHLTTDVLHDKTAGSKARVDVAHILSGAGYSHLNLPALSGLGQIASFLVFLKKRMATKGHIVLEYPFDQRKRAYVLYLFGLMTGVKIYAVIHDIAALRFKLSSKKDLAILRLFDGLIAHTPAMTDWLSQQGLNNKVVPLQIFDYCNHNAAIYHADSINSPLNILYAGNLAFVKATYVYDGGLDTLKNISLSAYGQYFEPDRLNNSVVQYKGAFDPNKPELDGRYHFGLVWEGTSLDTCSGHLGDYLRYNSPHKLSLYISLGLPIIIWDKASMARFVLDEGIGLTISSLSELDKIQSRLPEKDYQAMLKKLALLTPKIRNGDFLRSALRSVMSPTGVVVDSGKLVAVSTSGTASTPEPPAQARSANKQTQQQFE